MEFEGSASGGAPPYSYSWEFGNGMTSENQNSTITYQEPGDYKVTLTVTDNAGQIGTDKTAIQVIGEEEGGMSTTTIAAIVVAIIVIIAAAAYAMRS